MKQLDGKDLRGQTVRVVLDEVCLLCMPSSSSLIAFLSVLNMTVVVVTTAIVTVRTALSIIAVNARAPPVVSLMTAVDGRLSHAGKTMTAGRLVTREPIVARQNPTPVKSVRTAAGTKGSGTKKMTVVPGILTAKRATGKLTQKSYLKSSLEFPPSYWRKAIVLETYACIRRPVVYLSPCFPFHGPALS